LKIRPATIADIEQCQRLDGSYVSGNVWQMDETTTADSIHVSFRRVHIPRQVQVAYPRSTELLYDDWSRGECFLVADELGLVLGYLDMTVRYCQWQSWIEHLVVHPDYRNRSLATRLLQAAERWARGSKIDAIIVAMQTKNDPAIQLFTGRGYSFCGFVDGYFANGDIGLLYGLRLRRDRLSSQRGSP